MWTREADLRRALKPAIRCAMRATNAGWACVAKALPDGIDVTLPIQDSSVRLPCSTPFFSDIPSTEVLSFGSANDREAFGALGLVTFVPRHLVGLHLGDGFVLVIAAAEGVELDEPRIAGFFDAAECARAIVAESARAHSLATQLFQASPDAMLVVGSDGRIAEANHAAERLLAYGHGELSALAIEALVPTKLRAQHAHHRASVSTLPTKARSMGARSNLFAIRKDGSEIAVDIMLGPFSWAKSSYTLAILRDMTIRKETSDELQARESRLRQSQQMEHLGHLAASTAHDFNNLLTIVRSQSELIAMDPACPPSILADLKDIHTAAERGGQLTQQLLAYARRDAPRHGPLAVGEVIEDFQSLLHRLVGTTHDLEIEVAPKVGSIFADKIQIEQMLMNLVCNARDAMPTGGKVRVTVKRADVGAGVTDLPSGRYVAITVSDTGHGIPPEVLPRIFEPLYTTKPDGRGTGLGLAIVHRVATERKGAIRVRTEVSRGTTFTVFLPRLPNPSSSAPLQRRTVHPGSVRVLVVDDEPINRRILVTILTRAGYEVSAAGSAKDAFDLSHASPPDLLVSDVSMPGGSGPELLSSLRMLHPKLRAVFVSGNPTLFQQEAIRCSIGHVPLVQKPFSVESLTDQVRAALASSV